MIFSKIKLTKAGTLEATYKNEDGDVIQFAGANLVHKDLKEALQVLSHTSLSSPSSVRLSRRSWLICVSSVSPTRKITCTSV